MSNKYSLHNLIALLEEVKSAYNISIVRGEKGENIYLNPENSLVDEVSDVASEVLFKKGRVQFQEKQELQRNGFKVMVFDQNESGWLICGIHIPTKGILVYYNHKLLDEMEEGQHDEY